MEHQGFVNNNQNKMQQEAEAIDNTKRTIQLKEKETKKMHRTRNRIKTENTSKVNGDRETPNGKENRTQKQ